MNALAESYFYPPKANLGDSGEQCAESIYINTDLQQGQLSRDGGRFGHCSDLPRYIGSGPG
jgi:hypothetical protein